MNQFDFFKKFPTENDAIDFIVETKYKDRYVCPKCGCAHNKIYHQRYNRRNLYCNNCKCEFSALTWTIFEHIHLDIRMWLFAINLVLIACKGISGLQLQRELGMKSYKGAFRMMKLIRAAMGIETHKDALRRLWRLTKPMWAANRVRKTHIKVKRPRKASVAGERARHPLSGCLTAWKSMFTYRIRVSVLNSTVISGT